MNATVLIVDDDAAHVRATAEVVQRAGYAVQTADSGMEGAQLLRSGRFDVVVTDLAMRDRSGLDLIADAQSLEPSQRPEVVVVTGYGTRDAEPAVLRAGAAFYILKPLSVPLFREILGRAVERARLRRGTGEDASAAFAGMVGRSEPMQRLFSLLKRVADAAATVLIEGESGTGKELIARALHAESSRHAGPFVPVNCAALSSGLLESELFGHERGAFTGAERRRIGRIEAAHRGTLFLDEVGEMDPVLQAKLLRSLEEREVVRVGSNETIPVDVRVLAATHRDLRALVREGSFREDLFFRLHVVRLRVPPLRERLEDLPVLVESMLPGIAEEHGRPPARVEAGVLERMARYRWPGNVRELRNCLETMLLTATDRTIQTVDLPPEIDGVSSPAPHARLSMRSLAEVERELIRNTLRDLDGNRARAAKVLGISPRTLYRRIKELGLK